MGLIVSVCSEFYFSQRLRFLYLTIFCCLLQTAFAYASPVYDVTDHTLVLDEFMVELFVDSSNCLGIDAVAELDELFYPVNSRYTVKSIKKTYWFKFDIKNSSSEKISRKVGFDEVFFESVNLYYKVDSGWFKCQSGMVVPLRDREVKNRCPVFNVTLNGHETKTIYLQVYSAFSLISGIVVADDDVYLQGEQKKAMWYWFYFGAAIAIVIYNFFLLLYIRDKTYLYYVLYAFSFVVFTFVYSGYAQYVTANLKLLYGADASIAIMGAFITLFTRELLQTKQVSRRIDATLITISTIYGIIAVLIPVDIFFYQGLVLFGMPSMLFLLFTGLYAMSKRVPFFSILCGSHE